MNKVIFVGNLCRDVDLKKTVNDTFIGSTAIAVSRDIKNDKGEYETDFFELKFFGKTAEYASKYLRKGSKVSLVGRIQNREYINRDQVKVKTTEITVESIENLSPSTAEVATATTAAAASPKPEAQINEPVAHGENLDSIEITDDDLPF